MVAIGLNDAHGEKDRKVAAFRANLDAMLRLVEKRIVLTKFPYSGKSSLVDADTAEAINQDVLSRGDRVRVFDLAKHMHDALPNDFSTAFLPDHTHLSDKGYVAWRDGIQKAAAICDQPAPAR